MTKSLYERLGGSSGIAALVDDIVEAHMANPRIKSRFLPIARSQAPGRSEEAHFLGMGSGGPEQYSGRSMPSTHRGMNINAEVSGRGGRHPGDA